ncbi:uncharacterized protein LOC105425861 [Pogonomyrmex barbatus]|uniref:Uncharacterized protein LOC105425861 n=1 Tax=Pogonomyrmex barbatus TaxID=144034 RepID=A0A6I9W4Y0_9HYME|nr:uncharacterized protein LOC105425861 [Pogonomyrmex barbatus]
MIRFYTQIYCIFNMGTTLLVVILTAALSATANNINEQCQVHNERRITCNCIGNEEFFLPDEYNYTNIISVFITGCVSANLHYSSLPEASNLEEMIVQNISGNLDFEIFITSSKMKLLKLSNIGRIPTIASYTFTTLATIDTLVIENTIIENFDEEFNYVHVSHFNVTNVTIERVNLLNMEKGATLRIVNTVLRNVETSLNLNFLNIEIIDSKFKLQKPGLMSIQGDVAVVRNSIFSNVSMNLVIALAIRINGICADGKSTLRLSSEQIYSADNRLPNEIAYPRSSQHGKSFMIQNNTVCKAGNCECSKSSGQILCPSTTPIYILICLLRMRNKRFHI